MVTLRIHRFSLTFALFFGLASAENLQESEVVSGSAEQKIEEILGRSELLDSEEQATPPVSKENELPLPEDLNVDLPSESESPTAPLLPKLPDAGSGPGELSGVIFDSDGNGLNGAIIVFPKVGGFQVRSGPDGRFIVKGLPIGPLEVEVLKPAFQTKKTTITILEEGVTESRIGMEIKPVELAEREYLLEDREIVADVQEESFGGIDLGGNDGASLMSAIGRETFEKQNLSNAADAVGRISGANIVGGKYAVLRGLADRYITTTFNNGAITSADPSRKTVQLDLFPTSVIEAIGAEKLYNVTMPGDFGGGAINIQTLAMPDERFIKFGYEVGWNSLLGGDFYRNPSRSLGFRGDVDNPIPRSDIFLPNGSFPGGSGTAVPDPTAEAAWDRLLDGTDFVPRKSKPRPSKKFGLTYGDVFELQGDARLGVIASFSRKSEDSMQLNRVRSRPGIQRSWVQDDYTSTVDWGMFLSTQLEVDENNSIRAIYFRKHVAEDNYSLQRDIIDQTNGINFGVPATSLVRTGNSQFAGFGADAYYKGEAWQTDTTIRDLQLFQLTGDHTLWEDGLNIKWGYTKNESTESRPHSTSFRYGVLDFTDSRLAVAGDPFQIAANKLNADFMLGLNNPTFDEARNALIAINPRRGALFADAELSAAQNNQTVFDPSLGQVPTLGNVEYTGDSPGQLVSEILNQKIQEDTIEKFIDLEMPFYLGEDAELRVRSGFRKANKTRGSRGQAYRIDANNVPDSELYGPDSFGTDAATDSTLLSSGTDGSVNGVTVEDGNALEVRNFDGTSSLEALYLGAEFEWQTYLLGGGLRRETETRGYRTLPAPLNLSTVADKSGEISNTLNIPSLYLTKTFDDERFKVGAYFSRTVARPTFYEFLPAITVEQDTGFERRGEFNLQDTSITNFDLSFFWQITDDSSITISPFLKKLDDPIISVIRRSQQFIGFQNAEQGTLRGIELEWDIGEFAPFSIRGNYTFIDAELIAEINTGVNGFAPVNLQYPNQPEHILNVALGYDFEEYDLSCNLVYNFVGSNALFLRIKEGDANVISPALHTVDFNLQKKFELDHADLTLGLSIKNIFDTKERVFFEGGGSSFEGETYDVLQSGRSISLEGKIEF
ncbi:MAG: TonB-dependent receptor [Akkermansiaceae bacterium]